MQLKSENTRTGRKCVLAFVTTFRKWIYTIVLTWLCLGAYGAMERAVATTRIKISDQNRETYPRMVRNEIYSARMWIFYIALFAGVMLVVERKCSKKLQKVGDEIEWVVGDLLHGLYKMLVAIKSRVVDVADGEADARKTADEIAGMCDEKTDLIGKYSALADEFSTYSPEEAEMMNLNYYVKRLRRIWEGEAHGLRVDCEVPEEDVYIKAHPELVGIILETVIGNAVKYTDSGSVNITLEAAHGRHVRIKVTDTGRGMTKEEQDSVFDLFRRGSSSKDKSGNGMGLAFSRAVAKDLYHGDIEIDSTPGKGTTVTVTLPSDVTKSRLVSRLMSMLNPFGRKVSQNRAELST